MAAKAKRLFYNLILIATVVLIATLTAVGGTAVSSIALDQDVRCGLSEHSHTEQCYLDDVLICQQKAHVHSQNCYLVLLEDNDVNWLLQTMEDTDEKSLEGVIDSAMGQALVLNDSFVEETPPLELTQQDISSLNQTIEDNQIEPSVVLNENLQAGTTISYVPPVYDTGLLAIGDKPATANRSVNFYIQLDGKITFIGSGSLTNSSLDYYSKTNTVKEYTDVVVTGLTTGNINSTYYFRFNTDGVVSKVSDFDDNATYNNSNVRFGNSNGARYAILCTRSGSWNPTYSAVPFFTVTLDYSNTGTGRANQTAYVQSGMQSGLALSEEFLWYDSGGNLVTKMPATITQTTTLYAHPKEYKVTFEDRQGDSVASAYSAKPENGTLAVTLPSLPGKTTWYWIEKGSDGTTYYTSGQTVMITGDTGFVVIPDTYTVTLIDDTGQSTAMTVGYRQTHTFGDLPDGWLWVDKAGDRYGPGDTSSPITADTTYTAASRLVDVHYNVNFPSGAVSVVDSVPTIYGTNASTVTDIALGGKTLTVRDLTSRTARREISSSNKESVTYYFKGWTVAGTDILIPPDTNISWSNLESYIAADGAVHLQGVWEEGGRYNSATFFVRFDSVAVDSGGNVTSQPTQNYTPEVFNTHVGGVDSSLSDQQIRDTYWIFDTTSDNSYGADQAIRALYGEKATGMWLYDFPTDDYVFAYLKDYLANNPGKQLTYDGEAVNPAELNHDYYAIRWYVCKLEGSSWHIDGKVYRKEGSITVDKIFGGDDTVLQTEKDGFYILAENGTLDDEGNFVAYEKTNPHFKEYLLVVNQNGADALHSMYPDAQILIFDTETESSHHYQWFIDGVELGEYWHIEEFPVKIPGYSCYAEYTAYDTDGMHTAIAEYGTRASVIGKTFALDEDPDQGLMVEFHNYYYPIETIIIKKEDGKTGKPIGGAVFELWQNGNCLSFNYNAETEQYERDESGNGAFTQIVTSADGFSVISTTGFSYDYGDVVVKEVLPPAGYDPAPDITVGKDVNGEIVVKNISGEPPDQWDTIAKVPSSDALVVKNYAAEYISVTVEKVWNTNSPADSVVVVLQANGQHAAALFPGMTAAQVTLNAGNLWKHMWTDLPRYANGQLVTWGVKEIIIGGKPTLSDGVSFANWTVTYSPGRGTDTDGDGDIDNWKFIVTNSQKRLQMILTKVGSDGAILPGCTFSLEQVELVGGAWQPVAGTAVDIQTTDANGMLTFDNLTADVYYRLAELQAADGYFMVFTPVVVTMDGDGNIRKVLDDGTLAELFDPLFQVTGPFNVRVTNLKVTKLPETGGIGTHGYIHSGLLLMLISAMALLLYKRKRRREEMDTS